MVAQLLLILADPLGVAPAEVVVDEGAGAALVVVDDRDLEERPVGDRAFGELGDESDVVDHLRRDPAAGVAEHQRVAEVEAEEVRRVGPRVDAGDDEQPQLREDDLALVPAARREVTIAPERLLDPIAHPRRCCMAQRTSGAEGVASRSASVASSRSVETVRSCQRSSDSAWARAAAVA